MIQDVKYRGYSANPSDYECQDGDLALSLNLINEDGALKPVFQPKKVENGVTLSEGERILCIHKTAAFSHYIIVDVDGNISWCDTDNVVQERHDTNICLQGAAKASGFGNIVSIICSDGVHKFIWSTEENEESSYAYIGNKLPEARLSFGLKGTIIKNNNVSHVKYHAKSVDDQGVPTDYNPKYSEDERILTNSVLAAINRLVAYSHENGKFCQPFFVRYAYRLYDGSLTMQSAPILMLPSNTGCPIVLANAAGDTVNFTDEVEMTHMAYLPSCALNYAFEGSIDEIKRLKRYKDIIKSVDIFVSAPLYRYDQAGTCKNVNVGVSDNSFGIFALDNSIDSSTHIRIDAAAMASLKKHSRRSILETVLLSKGIDQDANKLQVDVPVKESDSAFAEIKDCANFYLIKSIPINELKTERTEISISKDVIGTLTARESLPDDFNSHETIIADNEFSYNSRLLLSGIKTEIFDGYFQSSFAETYLSLTFSLETAPAGYVLTGVEEKQCYRVSNVTSHLNRESKSYVVEETVDTLISCPEDSRSFYGIHYYYHPSPYVTKAEFSGTVGDREWSYTINPTTHSTLNGSSYFDEFKVLLSAENEDTPDVSTTRIPEGGVISRDLNDTIGAISDDLTFGSITATHKSTDKTVSLPNSIYVSEVNNPFLYPAQSVVSVGSGRVIAVSTAAQALSQGQFGSFPLYAFTTDGVWALSTSNTGTFVAVQPITRDVCINADSITQLDGSVLFTTSRGVMLISGSQVRCISDTIASDSPFDLNKLPHAIDLHRLVHSESDRCIPIEQFSKFIANARMIYDYIHQRVVIFNPFDNYSYAYVWSLKSMDWGMMLSDLDYTLNSYPEAVAVTKENAIVTFAEYNEVPINTLFITRPLKLGGSDVLKTIHSVYQRGYFKHQTIIDGKLKHGNVNTVLYGSRDMFTWFLIGSSKDSTISRLHGSPYKYYRIAGVAVLDTEKSLSGATIDVVPRENTKLH